MTGKSDDLYLLHILEAVEQIEEYLADCDLTSFLGTRLTKTASFVKLKLSVKRQKTCQQKPGCVRLTYHGKTSQECVTS